MNQFEFDKLMMDIRQEEREVTKKMREELAEIESRREVARKEYDDAQDRYKAICREIAQKQVAIKEAHKEFYKRKQSIIKEYPRVWGVKSEENQEKRNELYAIRAIITASLKDIFKDTQNIDVDNINIHFNTDGGGTTYTCSIPKINKSEEE